MEKLCTNKNHSYKHNEQINKQNIDNSECFGVKYVKIKLFCATPKHLLVLDLALDV